MNLIWKPQARADRMTIMEYIAQDNPGAAIELDELIEAKAEQLEQTPGIGRRGRIAGTRELVAHRHYVLVYHVDKAADTVVVLRVLHTAQRWPLTR